MAVAARFHAGAKPRPPARAPDGGDIALDLTPDVRTVIAGK